jgi:GNAT superfamily N-acetyltransferase
MAPAEGPQPLLSLPRVREARSGDGDDVARLLGELGYPCSADDAAERITLLGRDAGQSLWLAEAEGRCLGLMALDKRYYLPLGGLTCRITALVVDPVARRGGIGRALLRHAEALARDAGALRIELTTAAHREDAHRFYRACGFRDGALRFARVLGHS